MTVVNGVGCRIGGLSGNPGSATYSASVIQSLSFPHVQNGFYRQTKVVSAWQVDCTLHRMSLIIFWCWGTLPPLMATKTQVC